MVNTTKMPTAMYDFGTGSCLSKRFSAGYLDSSLSSCNRGRGAECKHMPFSSHSTYLSKEVVEFLLNYLSLGCHFLNDVGSNKAATTPQKSGPPECPRLFSAAYESLGCAAVRRVYS